MDQTGDRMVTTEEGQRRSKEIGCVCFHEISVRESIDQVSAYADLLILSISNRRLPNYPITTSFVLLFRN